MSLDHGQWRKPRIPGPCWGTERGWPCSPRNFCVLSQNYSRCMRGASCRGGARGRHRGLRSASAGWGAGALVGVLRCPLGLFSCLLRIWIRRFLVCLSVPIALAFHGANAHTSQGDRGRTTEMTIPQRKQPSINNRTQGLRALIAVRVVRFLT